MEKHSEEPIQIKIPQVHKWEDVPDWEHTLDTVKHFRGSRPQATIKLVENRKTSQLYIYKRFRLRPHQYDEHEAHILRKLPPTPSIVAIKEAYEQEESGDTYVAMLLEYIPGVELFDVVEFFHPPSLDSHVCSQLVDRNVDVMVHIMREMLRALNVCHIMGVAHMDMKLENVMVEQDTGRLVLIDFGHSKSFDDNKSMQLNHTLGTPGYAYHACLERSRFNPVFVDLFAVGCIMFLLLTGTWPFTTSETKDVYKQKDVRFLHGVKMHLPEQFQLLFIELMQEHAHDCAYFLEHPQLQQTETESHTARQKLIAYIQLLQDRNAILNPVQ